MSVKKKKISRKEFISKTGKCAGGLICGPMILSVLQSCDKPELLGPSTEGVAYTSTCPFHGSVFDQDGNVLSGQATNPLTQYSATITENSIIINDNNEIIPLTEHPQLEEVGGVDSLHTSDIDQKGLLLYRKSEDEIVVLSRECTHQQEQTGPLVET